MRIDRSLSAIATMLAPLALLVPLRKLQALLPPQTLDLLGIDPSALGLQQFTDLRITVSAILLGQPKQGKAQLIVILLG